MYNYHALIQSKRGHEVGRRWGGGALGGIRMEGMMEGNDQITLHQL